MVVEGKKIRAVTVICGIPKNQAFNTFTPSISDKKKINCNIC